MIIRVSAHFWQRLPGIFGWSRPFRRHVLPDGAGRTNRDGGAPIRRGEDLLRSRLGALLAGRDLTVDYEELDPDVFGEELDEPAYREIDRIAAICRDVTLPR